MNRMPILLIFVAIFFAEAQAQPWTRHTIDKASRGADGVRLGDADQDGRPDIATGWEEGGQIRICFQPETSAVKQPWASIAVGNVKSPEDAVFVDVNGDGWLDVVSCCEGQQQAIFFHINPGGTDVRSAESWRTTMLPDSHNATRWMFCEPLSEHGSQPVRLIFGSKNPNGRVALWTAGAGNFEGTFQTLRTATWIMSLRAFDVDSDGDSDIVFSDRKGLVSEIGWLENPGPSTTGDADWQSHTIGATGLEVMFLDIHRSPADAGSMLVCNTRNGHIQLLTPSDDVRQPWRVRRIAHPAGTGNGKAAAFAHIDGSGTVDIVATCEHSEDRTGVFWLSEPANPSINAEGLEVWEFHDISGVRSGVKYDRIELLDIDQDGDQDVLTCEERDNLGVVWYENPR